MHTFADKKDTEWCVELNVGIMEEAKDKLEIDLLDPISEDSQPIVDLSPINAENIKRFCNLLYLLCSEQCKEKDVPAVEFNKLLDSTAIKNAYAAFFAEWQDFFLSLDRMDVVEAMTKIRELMKEGVMKVIIEIGKMEFPTGSLSMNSPESQE